MSYPSASKKAIVVLSLALGTFAASERSGYPRLTASALGSHAGSIRTGAPSSHGDQLDVEPVWGQFGGVRKHADKSGHGHELSAAGNSFLHNEDLIKKDDQETDAHVRAAEAKRVHDLAMAKLAGNEIQEGYGAHNLALGSHDDFKKEQEKTVQSKVEKEHKKVEELRDERDNREKEACDKYFVHVTKTERRLAPYVKTSKPEIQDRIGAMVDDKFHGEIWSPRPLTREEFTEIFGDRLAVEDLTEYGVLLASGEKRSVFNASFAKKLVFDNEYAEPAAEFFWRRAPAYFQVEVPRPKAVQAGADAVDRKVAATLHRQAHQQDMKIDAAGASGYVHVRMIKLQGEDEAQPTTHSHFMKEANKHRIKQEEWIAAKESIGTGAHAVALMQQGKDREAAYDQKHAARHKEKSVVINQRALKNKQKRLQSAFEFAQKAVADVEKAIKKAGVDVPEQLTEKLAKKHEALDKAQANLDEVNEELAAAAPAPVATPPPSLPAALVE